MKRGGYFGCGIVLLLLSAGLQAATGAAILSDLLSAHPRLVACALEIHEWNGPVFVALIVIHVLANREWIKSQLFKKADASGFGAQRR